MRLETLRLAIAGAATLALLGLASPAQADSISPTSFSADLAVGGQVTVRKTVTVDSAPPTTGVLDVMFLFDNTGSMSAEINAAKNRANDILTSLSGFGSLAAGTGWYNDPNTAGLLTNLTTNLVQANTDINNIPFFPGSGGDADEQGVQGIIEASGASWRAGSSRFVIAFGDAAFKGDNANAIAALNAVNATFIGVGFTGGGSDFFSDANPIAAGTGGTTHAATATGDSIAAAIIAGIGASFDEYTTVTVSDLLGGLPLIGLTVACVSADTGACVGPDAVGAYDRSAPRSFEFDVTFSRLADGDAAFPTFALVDGAIVATESDRFSVPEPATLAILGLGLIGVAMLRRRRAVV